VFVLVNCFGMRERCLVVFAATCPLIFGAANLSNELLDVPLAWAAHLLSGVAWLLIIHSEWKARLSTVRSTSAPGAELMQAGKMVQERLPQTHALAKIPSPAVMSSVSLADVSGVVNTSTWRRRERQGDGRKLRKQAIDPAPSMARAGEAVRSSRLTELDSATPRSGALIDGRGHRFNISQRIPVTMAPCSQAVGTTAPTGEVARVREAHQPRAKDAVVAHRPDTSSGLWRPCSSSRNTLHRIRPCFVG
jgi:hypothetical protein